MQLALITYFWIMLGFAFFNGTLFPLEQKICSQYFDVRNFAQNIGI